jgi:hypothetical protein
MQKCPNSIFLFDPKDIYAQFAQNCDVMRILLGLNVINLFTAVIYECS